MPELLYDQGDFDGALAIIYSHENALEYQTEIGKRWVDLLLRISSATDNPAQLVVLYENFPKAFDSNEKNSLMVASQYILEGRVSEYELLRAKWKGYETRQHDWHVLDADLLVLTHEHPEAFKLLSSQTFEGSDDTGRLVRLALLSIPENSNAAWDYLTEANSKDPKNPESPYLSCGPFRISRQNSFGSFRIHYSCASRSQQCSFKR